MAETVSSQATLVAALTQYKAKNDGGGRGISDGVDGHTIVKQDKHE